jgi:hypothetical protein
MRYGKWIAKIYLLKQSAESGAEAVWHSTSPVKCWAQYIEYGKVIARLLLIKNHAMKTYGGIVCGSILIRLGTSWRWVFSFTFLSFSHSQSRSGLYGESTFAPDGNRTSVYRVGYAGSFDCIQVLLPASYSGFNRGSTFGRPCVCCARIVDEVWNTIRIKKTPWPESASELCRPSDSRHVSCGRREGSLRPYSLFSIPEPVLFLARSS